ncbi:1-phosphofructokinase family hexose kinase, partial [Streptomyces sp. NPDC057654]|uniref:1-phosphofructokinase family hexose kinase n=1 Tax=Streptomyces sp. NPDC057654 TaxID=3346196 RepID=UPI0036B731C2
MILTVTLNAALDITYRVPQLRRHSSHRVTEVIERPGGKGLNVARVLAALGHDTVVTGFAGGITGEALRARLRDGGDGAAEANGSGANAAGRSAAAPGALTDALVPIAGTTRRTVGVVDAATGDTTQLNEAGPTVTPAEWESFTGTYATLLADASAVALCGSLPPGVSVGAYAG